jgi:hypothetical protein
MIIGIVLLRNRPAAHVAVCVAVRSPTTQPPDPRFGERSSCLSRTDRFPQENWAACAPGDEGRGNRRRRRDGAATISSKASGGGGPG